jgi:outer membrane protein OmpA-like peptidoglycan-associated protein
MKKIKIIILLTVLTAVLVYSKTIPEFRIIADFNSYPYYYEGTHVMNGLSFNGALMAGMRLDKFSLGLEMTNNFNSLAAQDISTGLKGAWNIMRWTFNGYYEPISWFELKLGLGGAWYKSAFSRNTAGTFSVSQGGLSILLDGSFVPWKYITLRQINRLDLFFSEGTVAPYYYGGIRCDFHPYVLWLSLYLEVGGMTFFSNNLPVDDFKSGMFVWVMGVSIDISPARSFKKNEDKKKEDKTSISNDNKVEEKMTIEKKEEVTVNKEIENLKKAKEGDVITFSNILFYSNKDTIVEESFPVIDQIAAVLNDRPDIKIELIGNTNDVGNPDEEIKLSKKRAEAVKNYLVIKGINGNRIITTGSGSKFTKGANIDQTNRKVEIKILK